jgi:hypothetical protein
MTISQWLHSVWFFALMGGIILVLLVDKFFTIKISLKHPKPKRGGFTYKDHSLVDNKELDKFWGPVPQDDDPEEWRDFFRGK